MNRFLSSIVSWLRAGYPDGIPPTDSFAVLALLDDLSVHEPKARLWIQTEWLKAAIILARSEADEERRLRYISDAVSAAHALDATVRLYDALFTREIPDDVPEGSDFTANLNAASLEAAVKIIAGTARSMGLEIVG